jgi:hypothetical protein
VSRNLKEAYRTRRHCCKTPPGTVTIAGEHDDSETTLLTGISEFGDSIPPLFISKNKTFEGEKLGEQQLFRSHDYMIRSAEKTFAIEVLDIDWLQTQFIPRKRSIASFEGASKLNTMYQLSF